MWLEADLDGQIAQRVALALPDASGFGAQVLPRMIDPVAFGSICHTALVPAGW